jgi:hypothetical protein
MFFLIYGPARRTLAPKEQAMTTFDADQTHILARAFERAWEHVLRESKGRIIDMQSAREMVAKRIVVLAGLGETDEWRLARSAVIYFRTNQRRLNGSYGAHAALAGSAEPGAICRA